MNSIQDNSENVGLGMTIREHMFTSVSVLHVQRNISVRLAELSNNGQFVDWLEGWREI